VNAHDPIPSNTLGEVVGLATTSTDAYDPWGQRVLTAVTTSTTATAYYPTRFYNVTYGIPTKHIFANGEIVAEVIGTATSATTTYIHVDHLGGSNVQDQWQRGRVRRRCSNAPGGWR
jgi:hypothetical protein